MNKSKAPPTAENEGTMPDGSFVDVTGWLTRNQALDLLGCSCPTIVRWEREGRLHPAKARKSSNVRMVYVYDPHELARLPKRFRAIPQDVADGELAARVFELFDEGMTDREVVLQSRQVPAKIAEFREAWLDGGGSLLVISPSARAELTDLVGTFDSVADLVAKFRAKLPANETT